MLGQQIEPQIYFDMLLPIERHCGRGFLDEVMSQAGLLQPSTAPIQEDAAVLLHQRILRDRPDLYDDICSDAATVSAKSFERDRLSTPTRILFRGMPTTAAASMLTRILTSNQACFAGSGAFQVASWHPLVLEIAQNPFAVGLTSHDPVCMWHRAWFESLFRDLADPHARVVETHCCAQGEKACRFLILTGKEAQAGHWVSD